MGFVGHEQLAQRAHTLLNSGHGAYLLELLTANHNVRWKAERCS